jgi:hypothetical protein
VRPRRCHPRLLSCVHQSLHIPSGRHYRDQAPNPRPRVLCSRQKPCEPSLRPPWTSRDLFLSGLSHPKCVRIAITPDTVRPVHGAAIVEVVRDESGGSCECNRDFATISVFLASAQSSAYPASEANLPIVGEPEPARHPRQTKRNRKVC